MERVVPKAILLFQADIYVEAFMKTLLAIAASAFAFASAGASATVIDVDESAAGTGNNLLFNSCTDPRPAAINDGDVGCLNGRPAEYVYVYSNEAISENAGGQAVIVDDAGDGFNTMTIDFFDDSISFVRLVLNIIGVKKDGGGTVDFGDGFVFAFDDNGNNFFTITLADPGVNSFTFTASDGVWAEIKQVRFDFGDDISIPEPGMLGLLGLGIAGLGIARRRRTA